MYGIPLEPALILLKVTKITSSQNFALQSATRKIAIQLASGASGGGGGANTGVDGGDGNLGGSTTFGSYSIQQHTPIIASNILKGLKGQGGGNGGRGGLYAKDGNTSAVGGDGAGYLAGAGGVATSTGAGAAGGIGSGGGGGGGDGTGGSGGGGSASQLSEIIWIDNPSANYSVVIGAGGSGGTAGSASNTGGAGGSGFVIVMEYM